VSHASVRSLIRVLAALSFAAVAVWVFTARSAGPLPARPVPLETDADAPHPDHPAEAVLFRRLSLQDEKGFIPLDGLMRGVAHAKAMAANAATHAPDGGGRIHSIVISPTNASAMWIGSVSGGIWRSGNDQRHAYHHSRTKYGCV
jgi:hypothetical protein